MAELKSLVIKVDNSAQPQGAKNVWSPLTTFFPTFTKKIITPAIVEDKSGNVVGNIGAIVSGMPTVFARANLFRNALDNITDDQMQTSGLLTFYKTLIDEWRGFIACIALNYNDISIRRVQLAYSDGKDKITTENIYEPKGAFGNLLFDRKPLWCDLSVDNSIKTPFVDIVLYKGKVVGGTSPDSFLFTSVSYAIEDNQPFINKRNKKFTNPLRSDITPQQVKILYSYVKFINNNIDKFRRNFDHLDRILKPVYGNINGNLQTWLSEIEAYAATKNILLEEQIPEVGCFNAPYNLLFNYSTELFGSEGIIYTESGQGRIMFNPNDLLLDPLKCEIANIDCGENINGYLEGRSLYLIKAEVKGEPGNFNYFALPLSPLGLNVFGKNLGSLIGIENSDVRSRISAEYDLNTETLKVTLRLLTEVNREISKSLNYKVAKRIIQYKDILLWPNFISKFWGKYYMYSELPHNSPNWQANPFVVDTNDEFFRILADDKGNPIYLATDGKATDNVLASLKIVYNNSVADIPYKYEIFESSKPFKGVKFSFQGKDGGFAIIRYGVEDGANISNRMHESVNLKEAALGIDFGSTNTSVAYYSITDQKLMDSFQFKNRRVSLLASDNKNNNEKYAVEDEIFFFQNDEILSNAIKSIITLHDFKRINKEKVQQTQTSLLAEQVKGGFPCFEKNLPIDDGTDNRYYLKYPPIQDSGIGVGRVELVHNMKWSSHEIENSHKKAYLSSLLLHVYAQLFAENHYPKTLKWSYPSSMSQSLIGEYSQIWATLNNVNPLANADFNLTVFPANQGYVDTTDIEWGNLSDEKSSSWGAEPSPEPTWGNETSWDENSKGDTTDSTDKNTKRIINKNEINIKNEPLRFNFITLNDKESLTESCAVANYLANKTGITTNINYLTICFDIGGSTTDISALCQMNGPNGSGLAMVKQSSIRFAAQRVSQATKNSKNFRSVLATMLERKNVTIQGINKGENKYSSSTAPYYFEQLVDRLSGDEFTEFYKLLGANCKELVCVDLYITGLIMFYAGQLSLKLKNEIDSSPDKAPGMDNWKPKINIVMTGKGARIFDWFNAINPQASKQYYNELFIKGFGGIKEAQKHLSGPPNINPLSSDNDLKYEVSKGLALSTGKLYVPKNNVALELLGEEGFQIIQKNGQRVNLPFDYSVNGDLFENLGTYFIASPLDDNKPCPKFMDFAASFYGVASQLFNLPMTQKEFLEGFKNMNMDSYIKQLPEYKLAQESRKSDKPFDFSAPIIILEGMRFLEEVLLKKMDKI